MYLIERIKFKLVITVIFLVVIISIIFSTAPYGVSYSTDAGKF